MILGIILVMSGNTAFAQNTTMSMHIQSEPTPFNLKLPQDRQIHLRFLDANNNPIKNMGYSIVITRENQQLLTSVFYSNSGSLTLNLQPSYVTGWGVHTDYDNMGCNDYSSLTDDFTIYVPMPLQNGTYHFEIQPTMPHVSYGCYIPKSMGIKFETTLNLLDSYNKTLTPDANFTSQQISHNQTTRQSQPIANPECVNKIMAQEHAQDVPIDNVRALDLATNYTQYKLKTLGHNYTLDRIYHEFSIDSSIDSCTAQLKDVVVEFTEKNSAGRSLITITEDLGLDRVKTMDISQVDELVTPADSYMTPVEPQIDSYLILFVILAIGSISATVFFIFRIRKKN